MSYVPLNPYDLQSAAEKMAGSQITDEVGFLDVAGRSARNVFMEGPTNAIIQGVKSVGSFFQEKDPNNILSGAEANKQLGLTLDDEFAFDEDDEVTYDDLWERDEKMFSERMTQIMNDVAESQGEMVGLANFAGGLAGGLLDPVSLVGGALLGAAVRTKTALFALKHSHALRNYPAVLKAAKAAAHGTGHIGNALDAMAGAAVIDGAGITYMRNKYDQDFQTQEYLYMIAGAGVFGVGLPAFAKSLGYDPKGRELAKAQKKFKDDAVKTFGSDADKAADTMMAQSKIAEDLDAIPDETVPLKMQEESVWTSREEVPIEVETPDINTVQDVQSGTFYLAKRDGDKSFRKVSDYGAGTQILIRSKGVAKNLVQDLDGKHSGKVQGVKVKTDKILTNENFVQNRIKLVKKFTDDMRALINKVDNKEEGISMMEELMQLQKDMSNAKNMNELHDLAAGTSISRVSDIYFNAAVKKVGFDGYHVRIDSPTGAKSMDGVVIIDAMNKEQIDSGDIAAEFFDELGDSKTTADGVQTLFDNNKLGLMEEDFVDPADLKNPKIKELRKKIGKIQTDDVKRMSSPEGKKGYDPATVKEEEIVDAINKTESGEFNNIHVQAAKETVDAIDAVVADVDVDTTVKPVKFSKVKAGEYTVDLPDGSIKITKLKQKNPKGKFIWEAEVNINGEKQFLADADTTTLKAAKEKVNEFLQGRAEEQAPKSKYVNEATRELIDKAEDRLAKSDKMLDDFVTCLGGDVE